MDQQCEFERGEVVRLCAHHRHSSVESGFTQAVTEIGISMYLFNARSFDDASQLRIGIFVEDHDLDTAEVQLLDRSQADAL
jgi:hypothetical protein